MPYYDYKVVPAPRRMKQVRGVKSSDELFALTLSDAINEQARQGWEYLRSESLTAETPSGWFRRGRAETQTVLVFRQARETLGPTLAAEPAPAARPAETRPQLRPEPAAEPALTGRPFVDRVQSLTRREPALEPPAAEGSAAPTPLRPAPRLGPADRS